MDELGRIERQVFAFLQQTGARTGLVILRDAVSREVPVDIRAMLNVFVLGFENFRQLLATGTLADHLRQERNRAAHGLR
jgi:hypothetical protein